MTQSESNTSCVTAEALRKAHEAIIEAVENN